MRNTDGTHKTASANMKPTSQNKLKNKEATKKMIIWT